MHPYQLVACSFHDELEALATLRQQCQIVYNSSPDKVHQENDIRTVNSRIIDIYARDRADFLKLQDGTVIRLDHLISVNDKPVRFATSPYSCS